MPGASAYADKACVNRLQKEYRALLRDPVPDITAHPSEKSILEWHYCIKGSPDSPYDGGVYHGKVVFPSEYPYKPPAISMLTPNGRFATSTRLCLSMSDYHPETWNPMWSVASILNGLRSFMYEEAPTAGSISSSTAERRRLAAKSLRHNVGNATFRKLFPEWVEEQERRDEAEKEAAAQRALNGGNADDASRDQGGGTGNVAAAFGDVLDNSPYVKAAVFVILLAVLLVPLVIGDV